MTGTNDVFKGTQGETPKTRRGKRPELRLLIPDVDMDSS